MWFPLKRERDVNCRPLRGKINTVVSDRGKQRHYANWTDPDYRFYIFLFFFFWVLNLNLTVLVCIFKCSKKLFYNDVPVCLCQMADAEMHLETSSAFLPSCCVSVSLASPLTSEKQWLEPQRWMKEALLMMFTDGHQICCLATYKNSVFVVGVLVSVLQWYRGIAWTFCPTISKLWSNLGRKYLSL